MYMHSGNLCIYYFSLLKYEEKSFKYTNAFTSAGEGSVLDMSKRYRHLQHNKRAAAARALKKAYKIEARDHICDQIMVCSTYVVTTYVYYTVCTYSVLNVHS